MARPEKEIRWNLVEKMMECGSSAREIAGSLHISMNTFYDRFKKEYKKSFCDYFDDFHYGGKGNLRTAQYMKAMNGNVAMQMFLGREWLGQGKEEMQHSPYQDTLDLSHENMILRAELQKLKTEKNVDQSKTG